MEKTYRFHIEMYEDEKMMLDALANHYTSKLGIKVSKASAVKLAIKLAFKKEGV
jgi:hypothetical protein